MNSGELDIVDQEHETGNHVALVSGGMDSAVAAHVSVEYGPADLLVYLDTRTGVTANREYIETLADFLDVQLWVLRTDKDYEKHVKQHGFPGPSRHQINYILLKQRQLRRLATLSGGRHNPSDLHYWTGVRSDESERRMKHVEPENSVERWTWHAPIHDWTKNDCREWMDTHDIPANPGWDNLHRSMDCFCGCYGSPSEVIDLRAGGYDDHADWIRNLEEEVDLDEKQEREVWAWAALDEEERKAARASRDQNQMLLCSGCEQEGFVDDVDEDERVIANE